MLPQVQKDQCSTDIETTQLIYGLNQLTVFSIGGTLVLNGLTL